MMIKEIVLDGRKITYELEIKKVKNVNLRIRADGSVYVSANRRVSRGFIEEFMRSKSEFILRALEKCEKKRETPCIPRFSEAETKDLILKICGEVYPYYEKIGVGFPKIKFRKMVSRWGSCNFTKGILTFNTNLMYAPEECIRYVVLHEFTHFLVQNHSKSFYDELSKVCPEWRLCKNKLCEIKL